MDTGSHLLFGATLAGLAYLDPAVAQHSGIGLALIAGTMIGSHAPDLDMVVRLKSYSAYVKHHRGLSHSIPALFLWPLVIAFPLALIFHVMPLAGHLYFWTMIAVMLHVLLDLFNAYGVQCARPFSNRWLHLDTLALFEPFLIVLHLSGLGLWVWTDLPPGPLFAWIYGLTFVYMACRYWHRRFIARAVREVLQMSGRVKLVPGLHWFKWQYLMENQDYYYTGHVRYKHVTVQDKYERAQNHLVIEATKGTDGVRAFLQLAQNIHVRFTERENGYEVQWRDVRFWHNQKLPFGADVILDRNLNVISDRVGWNKKYWDPPYV